MGGGGVWLCTDDICVLLGLEWIQPSFPRRGWSLTCALPHCLPDTRRREMVLGGRGETISEHQSQNSYWLYEQMSQSV